MVKKNRFLLYNHTRGENVKVIITAGGTGGHIYPALSIINKIKEKESNSEILYIGTHNRMEKDIIPTYSIKYIPLEIYGLSKKDLFRNIKNINLIRKSYKKCKKIIKEFKPDIVIGVGGYVTFPVILAAHKLNIKTFIHEQNSIPGKSNKFLEKYVDAIGISFIDSKKYFKEQNKVFFTGNPCSENAIKNNKVSKTKYNIKSYKKLVLIVSGSLGSSTINNKMIEYLNSIKDKKYEVIYVTGKDYYNEFIKNKFPSNVHIYPFIENMSGLLKDVDVIVSRAGASSLSEILALKVPSIIIPSPYVANNHQYYNALSLKENNACIMIEESDLKKDILINSIDKCLNEDFANTLKENMNKLCINDSSTKIYEIISNLIK